MSEGRAHRRDGDEKAALQSFLAADAIMHVPTTGFEVARSEMTLGQLVEARDELLTVARIPDAGNEPHVFTEARDNAKALSAELEPKIPSLVIKIVGADGRPTPAVTVDGAVIPPIALTAPRAVDPGHHVVTAAIGSDTHTSEVDVKESETQTVTLDFTPAAASEVPPPTPAHPSDPLRVASYVGFGVGGTGIIVGAITGVLAITSLSAAKNQGCIGNACPPAADSDLSTSNTMATVSTIGFITGGVAIAAGVTTYLLSRRHPAAAASTTTALTFGPSPRSTGLGIVF